MPEPARPTPRDWAVVWEEVAAATSRSAPFEGVYTGPVWENPMAKGSETAHVWKLAVLQRQPSGGAEHWGHLFLVVGTDPSEVSIRPEGGLAGDPNRPSLESLPRGPGSPFEIRVRPRSVDTDARLRAFAEEFQRHALAVLTG
jgi:hypothetical protein